MAFAATTALSATDICPAAAKLSVPLSAPPRMSLVDTPALASSVSASAAWVAENWVEAPAAMAACRSWASSLAVPCVAAFTPDIALSNFEEAYTARPNAATSAKDAVRDAWSLSELRHRGSHR